MSEIKLRIKPHLCECGKPCVREELKAKQARIEKLEESLKVKHFSSCSDGGCDISCSKVFKHHFDCWLEERTNNLKSQHQQLQDRINELEKALREARTILLAEGTLSFNANWKFIDEALEAKLKETI